MMNRRLKSTLLLCLFTLCMLAEGKEAGVRVLLDSMSVNVLDADAYTLVHYRKFVINDPNMGSHANIEISMDKCKELTALDYQMSDLQGRPLRKVRWKDLKRVEYSSDLATDAYLLTEEVTPPTYPVVIESCTKITRRRNILAYPAFSPISDYDMEVEHASYQIRWPEKRVDLRYNLQNMQGVKPEVTHAGSNATLRLAIDHLAPIPGHRYLPSLEEFVPYALFAPSHVSYYGTEADLSTWQGMGQWMDGLAADRQFINEELRQRLAQITKDCSTELERVTAIYSHLAEHTRYVSIQLGIGGYQPALAMEVYQAGFGDCKGLSNYMHSLLKEVGIESRLIVIGTHKEKLLEAFPSSSQLNHMVLEVFVHPDGHPDQTDTLWVECTNPKLPLGFLHPHIAGHQALALAGEQSGIVTLPHYVDSLNQTNIQVQITLDDDASARIEMAESCKNSRYADCLELLQDTKPHQASRLKAQYLPPQAEVLVAEVADRSTPGVEPRADIQLSAQCAKFGNKMGKRLFLPLAPLHGTFSPYAEVGGNPYSLRIRSGYRHREEVTYILPEGYVIEHQPADVVLEEDFGSFSLKSTVEEGRLVVSLVMTMKSGTYPNPLRQRFSDMQKEIAKAYRAKIVLTK